jgi:hypothetical protein
MRISYLIKRPEGFPGLFYCALAGRTSNRGELTARSSLKGGGGRETNLERPLENRYAKIDTFYLEMSKCKIKIDI